MATRDAPAPPPALRPSRLSVTQIERLIRDPYAIYAEKTLGLRKLDPLRPTPDARLRGTLLHDIVHVFVDRTRDGLPNDPGGLFMEIAQERLNTAEDWPVARHLWLSSLANSLPEFLAGEGRRRVDASPGILEQKGEAVFDEIDSTLVGKPDRIDRAEDAPICNCAPRAPNSAASGARRRGASSNSLLLPWRTKDSIQRTDENSCRTCQKQAKTPNTKTAAITPFR